LKQHLKKDLKRGSPYSMFMKVLIADDLDSITAGVLNALKAEGLTGIDIVHYCDDAYLRIKAAQLAGEPFDLLITDLSFKADHREQMFRSGEELAAIVKKEHPAIKVIVYSIEDRLPKVRSLLRMHNIDGYVCKGRKGLHELVTAIQSVQQGNIYLSPQVMGAINPRSKLEIDDYDVELLKQLANGLIQDEISAYFKQNNIKPSSLSTIEKQLQILRQRFKAKNVTQLVANAKDLGVI
jgi:DNA-binding NarL/FixJ family response regulator